jgi:chromosomal replication initiator protein
MEEQTTIINTIISEVCLLFGLNYEDLCKKTRKREIVQGRQLCYYLVKEVYIPNLALKTMPVLMFNMTQDHSSVIHACNQVKDLIDVDKHFRKQVYYVKERIETVLNFSASKSAEQLLRTPEKD